MAAISQTISNVLGGMSSQPDSVKIPGQVRKANNVYLDPTFGCSKRPGTEFIQNLGNWCPEDAKWFPIFRDNKDRYMVCYYKKNNLSYLRVFTADTGEERTVTMKSSGREYIAVTNLDNLRPLTVNDYTFLVNSEKEVLMNGPVDDAGQQQGLVVINQVAYNTTYAVDFLRDGEEVGQTKIYKASKISISPASFEVLDDDGACGEADVENFIEDSGSATGLGFRVDVTCDPTLVTTETPGLKYPKRIEVNPNRPEPYSYGPNVFAHVQHGSAGDYQAGSYLYSNHFYTLDAGTIEYRIEFRVVANANPDSNGCIRHRYELTGADIIDYSINEDGPEWSEGVAWVDGGFTPNAIVVNNCNGNSVPEGWTYGIGLSIATVGQADDEIEYDYKSKYKVRTSLNNGGFNWSVGDSVQVTMSGRTYTITVDETTFGYAYEAEATASYTTAADTESGTLNINDITSALVAEISELANYTARPVGNVVIIERTDDRDFNIQTRGGTANSALYGLKDAVNDVSLLPPHCEDGILLRVANTEASDADDYYVKFKTEGGIPGQGAWEETIKPGIPKSLNSATMPHALIREEDGSFTLRPLTVEYDDKNFWQDRKVGDETTSPPPTFVNKTIQDAFFYQNRLGFMSEDTVILSQAGDYFNFFQGSAIAISDSDPIDMSTSTTRPAKLRAAIGTPSGLLMFAENSQFLLKSEDVAFGPSTVKIDEISNFAYRSKIHPVETGVSILFTTESDTFSKVFELATDSLNSRPQISDNTRIVPELIPPGLSHITTVPNQSLVIMGTGDKTLYVFKFFNSGNERQLAGWTTWEMSSDIKSIAFDHDTGFMISRKNGLTLLTKLELLDDPDTSPISALGTKFQPRLDHWVGEEKVTVEAIAGENDLRIRIPTGIADEGNTLFLAATYGGSETFYVSAPLQNDSTGDFFICTNKLELRDFVVGVGYDMTVELPSFYVKEGDNNRSDRRNPPMIENVYINVFMSGRYDCDVAQKGYATRTIPLEMAEADLYEADSATIQEDGIRAIGVYGRGDLVRLTIKAESPLPAALTSYSWEGHYSTRGIARR